MNNRRDCRIHIFGASGSGTTTLGSALSKLLECAHFDTDQYYWQPTDPPFRVKREVVERVRLLHPSLESARSWALSGSLCSWGDVFVPMFDLVVYLWIPPDVRLARLRVRELTRYGEQALAPGGSMRRQHIDFMNWAAAYDTADGSIRSRVSHEAWMSALTCPVLRLEGDMSTEDRAASVARKLAQLRR